MSQPKSNEERATEIWALIHSGLVKDGVKFPENFDGIGAAYGGYVRLIEALAQKDAEVEKAREDVKQMIAKMARKVDHVSEEDHEGSVRYFVDAANIYNIAKDYGYFKSQPKSNSEIVNVVPRNWNSELRSCVLSIPADEDRSRLIRAIQDELFDWKSKDYKNLGQLEDGIWWQGRNTDIHDFLTACMELKNIHLGDSAYMEGYQNAIMDVVSAIKRKNLEK